MAPAMETFYPPSARRAVSVRAELRGTPGLLPLEGGLPLFLGGLVIGAIGVSGMQSSQDLEIATIGAAAVEIHA